MTECPSCSEPMGDNEACPKCGYCHICCLCEKENLAEEDTV